MRTNSRFLCSVAAVAQILASALSGQISITESQLGYVQDFDSLPVPAVNGEALEWIDGVTLPGWYRALVTSTGAIDNSRNWSGNGSIQTASAPALFNWGSEGTQPISDRALGLRIGSGQTGALAVALRNDSQRPLVRLFVRFRGEQWRRTGQLFPTQLSFAYKVAASFDPGSLDLIQDPDFVAMPELNFVSPVFTSGATGTDGNSPTYVRLLAGSITLAAPLQPGQVIILRWTYDSPSFSGHGLAVDDFEVVFSPTSAAGQPTVELLGDTADPQVSLRWPALPGTLYTVQKSSTLQADDWAVTAEVNAHTDQAEWLDPEPLGDRAFYRIVSSEPSGDTVWVADLGAIPDDGECDAVAIANAVERARLIGATRVQFAPGVYQLRYREGFTPTILLTGLTDFALVGAKDEAGNPLTVLELNLPLENDFGVRHITATACTNLTLENLVFDLSPRYTTAAQVTAVDRQNKIVQVEILPGQTHFEGMKCYSSNAWNLQTRDLLPVSALTINMNEPYFQNLWQRVPDPSRVLYEIRNMPFSDIVNVGDGISWHFSVTTTAGFTFRVSDTRGLTLHNLRIHNAITLAAQIYDTWDVRITQVDIWPTGNSLAVGSRDGIQISNGRGTLLVDGLRVKGVRWDPFVSRVNFMTVTELNAQSLVCTYSVGGNPDTAVMVGDMLDFWSGARPFRMRVAQVTVLNPRGDKILLVEFDEPIPEVVQVGSLVSAPTWDEAIIRNSTFEGNFGTPIVYENRNLTIENNVFRNNSYSAIGIGPTSLNTGAFGDTIVIRNNHFSASGWVSKYGGDFGIISTFEQHALFTVEPYNQNILIEDNTFEDLNLNALCAGIMIRNAADVVIRNNTFIRVPRPIVVDPASTLNITW